MSDNRKIGVFDSGLGGLTVWRELKKHLPHESLVYFGDGKNCPYGDHPSERVAEFVEVAARILIEEVGVKMLVLACNSATATAVDRLRARYDIPIVGMEPAVKPAAMATRTGVIGILATAATLKSALFSSAVEKWGESVKIVSGVGEGFVQLVEANRERSAEAREQVARVLEPMLAQGVDQIVLGCTHYPFLSDVMREVIGDRDVTLVDPAPAIARRVEFLLDEKSIAASEDNVAEYEFRTLADERYLETMRAKCIPAHGSLRRHG